MQRAFFGTLLSHAKSELTHIEPLLIRASHEFFLEQSIDRAIDHLQRAQELLRHAKYEYVIDHPQTTQKSHHTLPEDRPRTKCHLS